MRMLWFGFVLLLCAGFAAYMGAVQLERSRQGKSAPSRLLPSGETA